MAVAQGLTGRKRHGLSLRPRATLALLAAVALHGVLGWGWTHQGLTGATAVSTHAHAPGRTGAVLLRQPAQRAAPVDPSAPGVVQALSPPLPAAPLDTPAQGGTRAGPAGEGGELAPPDAQATAESPLSAPTHSLMSGPQWLRGRYAPSESLDQGPRPQLGWFLDEDALAPLPFGSMLVQLWVSAEGHIDRAELLRADPPGDWALRALRPLPGTPMRPGLRAGQPVASTLVVELVSDNERLR